MTTVVSRMAQDKFLLVPNAANREKDHNWLVQHAKGYDVKMFQASRICWPFKDQKPKNTSRNMLNRPKQIERFKCISAELAGIKVLCPELAIQVKMASKSTCETLLPKTRTMP